jgi:hypothetical protein
MPGGVAEFRRKHPNKANKIEADGAISVAARDDFWQEVERWNRGSIEDFVTRACRNRQYLGPPVALGVGERVGTAQRRDALASGLSRQKPPRLPALVRSQVDLYLVIVELEPSNARALDSFKRYFGKLRLRTIRGSKRKTRIFAFRNPASPVEPLQFGSIATAFDRLSIPGAAAADYLLLAYQPRDDDLVHQPTCFDANIRNLEDFIPGGKTAGGMDEVITTPPRCIDVTHAPRSIL